MNKKHITKQPIVREYLTPQELALWERELPNAPSTSEYIAALYFLFGCYTGIRPSDWYRINLEKDVLDNKIMMRKKNSLAPVEIPITEPLAKLIRRMEYVTLKNITEPALNYNLMCVGERLGINKRITAMVARHTYVVTNSNHNNTNV